LLAVLFLIRMYTVELRQLCNKDVYDDDDDDDDDDAISERRKVIFDQAVYSL